MSQWRRRAAVTVLALALGCVGPFGSVAAPAAAAKAPDSAATQRSSARILFQAFTPTVPDTLFTMRRDGSDVRQLPLDVPGPAINPDWSPDGRHIVFVVQQPDGKQSIWVARANGRHARELLHCGPKCLSLDYPAWSPDGDSIAFTFYNADPPPTAGPPAADSIRVLDLASGRQHVVAHSSFPQLLDLARWSPDGTHLVIQIDRFSPDGAETGSRVAIVRLRNGRLRPLTPFSMFSFHPDWSSRGNKIVFATYDFFVDPPAGQASNIFTIHPDGTHQRQLTQLRPGNRRVAQPTFTPNGNRVVFTYQDASGRHAAFTGVGGGPIQIIPDVFATHPRLSPEARTGCQDR